MARRLRPRVDTVKHYIQLDATVVANAATLPIVIVQAVARGASRANTFTVEEGSTVTAIYLEYWVSGVTAEKTASWFIVKRPSALATPTFAETQNLQAYTNKRNILNAGQGLAPTGGNILPIYKQWIKIPRGKQRMALGDIIQLNISAVGTNVNICGFSTYKEEL